VGRLRLVRRDAIVSSKDEVVEDVVLHVVDEGRQEVLLPVRFYR
jgi:hypothetical protein